MQGHRYQHIGACEQFGTGTEQEFCKPGGGFRPVSVFERQDQAFRGRAVAECGACGAKARRRPVAGSAERRGFGERQAALAAERCGDEGCTGETGGA